MVARGGLPGHGKIPPVRSVSTSTRDGVRGPPSNEECRHDLKEHPAYPTATSTLMHLLICRYQITPKTSLNTRCSASILPNFSIKGRIRSSDQLGRW